MSNAKHECEWCKSEEDEVDMYAIVTRPLDHPTSTKGINESVMLVCADCITKDMSSPTPKLGIR